MDDHLENPADAVSPYPSYYEGPRLDFPLPSNSKPGEFQNRINRKRAAGVHDLDCTLWVGNLDHRVSETIIRELFLQIGPIQSIVFPKKKEDPSKRRGFCFVNFFHPKSVPKAIETLGETVLFGRKLILKCRPDSIHASHQSSTAPPLPERFVQVVDDLAENHVKNQERHQNADEEDCRMKLKNSTRDYSPIRIPPSPERKFRRTVNIVRSFRTKANSPSSSPERKVLVVQSSLNDSEPEVKIKITNNHRISSVVVTPAEKRPPSEPSEQPNSSVKNDYSETTASCSSAAKKISSKIIPVALKSILGNSETSACPPAEKASPAPQKIPVVQIPPSSAQTPFPDSGPQSSFGNTYSAAANAQNYGYDCNQNHQNFQPPDDSYYFSNNYYDPASDANWLNHEQQQHQPYNRYFWYNNSQQQYGHQQRYHPYQNYTNWNNNYYPRGSTATAPHFNPSFWSAPSSHDDSNYSQPSQNYQQPLPQSSSSERHRISGQKNVPVTTVSDEPRRREAQSPDKHHRRSPSKYHRGSPSSSSSSSSSVSKRRHYRSSSSSSSSSSNNNDQVTSSSHVRSKSKSSRNDNCIKERSSSGGHNNDECEYDPNNPRY